jgi:hypothetical protein
MARKIAICLTIATSAFLGSLTGVMAQASDSAASPTVTASVAK